MRLEDNHELQKDYMIRKIGLDPNDAEEVAIAYEIFLTKGLVTKISDNPPTYSHWPQICLMKRNITVAEYATCLSKDPYPSKKPAISTATYSTIPQTPQSWPTQNPPPLTSQPLAQPQPQPT